MSQGENKTKARRHGLVVRAEDSRQRGSGFKS